MSREPARAGASQRGGRCPRAGPSFLLQPRPRTPSLSRTSSCCHPLLPARLSWAGLRAACRASFPGYPRPTHTVAPQSLPAYAARSLWLFGFQLHGPCLSSPQACLSANPATALVALSMGSEMGRHRERSVTDSSEGARGLLFSLNFGSHMSNTPCCVTRVCT